MTREHRYGVKVEWTGNRGSGTAGYRAYSRDHLIIAGDKPPIAGSSDAAFLGDAARWNPEELLVASLAACHKLWYLHLCADAGIAIERYEDAAEGVMIEEDGGSGRFGRVVLRPRVEVRKGNDPEIAERLHAVAHSRCFIANSVDFPVDMEPSTFVAEAVVPGRAVKGGPVQAAGRAAGDLE